MGSRSQDAGLLLLAAIRAIADENCSIAILRERPWASITFSGTRHYLEIVYPAGAEIGSVEAFAKSLPDIEFYISGHFVADFLIKEIGETASKSPVIRAEVLTIEDPVCE